MHILLIIKALLVEYKQIHWQLVLGSFKWYNELLFIIFLSFILERMDALEKTKVPLHVKGKLFYRYNDFFKELRTENPGEKHHIHEWWHWQNS